MIAYTGIETISNMAEEAKDEGKTIPAAINRVQIAVFAIYFTLPSVALSALPVTFDASRGEYVTLLGLPEDEGGFAGDPILGVVKSIDLGVAAGPRRALRRPAGGHDPVPGDERGDHRRLAARLLDGHLPAAARPVAAPAPEVRHAVGRDHHLRHRARCSSSCRARPTFLGNLYAFGAMLSFTIAHISVVRLRIIDPDRERPYRAPFNIRIRGHDIPGSSVFGGLATFAAFVVVTVLHPAVAISGVVWLVVRASASTCSTAATRAST